MDWNCHYCKKKFKLLYSRDTHHRTHVEHYKMLFEASQTICHELEAQIRELIIGEL